MSILAALCAATWLCAFAIAPSAHGQAETSTTISREEFEKRLQEIDNKYKSEIEARDKAIEDLRAQVSGLTPKDEQWIQQERDKTTRDSLKLMLAQIDSDKATTFTPRSPVSFNPEFAVVNDFLGTWTNNNWNKAYNRFDVREVELDLRAAVDPRADAVSILALPRDVANPVFPDGEFASGPEASVEIEEAYLFFHDFGVPNLTAKVGRFHVWFGRQNLLHLHDLPTSDPSLVNQSFLAPESLTDSGVSVSYVVPNPWGQYFEVIGEVLTGEGAGSESPTLTGDLSVKSPGTNLHALWNHDLSKDWNIELGASWLWGHADPDNRYDVNLFGGDLTLLHTDPSGGFNNLIVQGEFIHGIVDHPDNVTDRSWGAYLLGQQQLGKDWYAGARLDWTENPNDPSQAAWAISPYVSWYWSEFLRFRVEYQHRDGDVPDQNIVMFQLTWIFGAHPPHPYWSMR